MEHYTLSSLRQDIIDNNLQVKAIIQDVLSFRGSVTELETLNDAGRTKLSALRKCIGKLDDWAKDAGDANLVNEVDTYREEFSKTLQAFRKANVETMLEIEKTNRYELMSQTGNTDLRKRVASKNNRTSLVGQQDTVVDKMLSISQHLSETTEKSAITLEALASSSQCVEKTRDELENTGGTISQSGRLLQKYGKRECTDKILLFFAFIFFLACVLYIVLKRLF